MNVSDILKERALEIGFDLIGIAPVSVWPDLEFSRQWVACGCGGEMRYLSNPRRRDPRLILPSAQSVICVGIVYNVLLPYSIEVGKPAPRTQKAEPRAQNAENRGQNPVSERHDTRGEAKIRVPGPEARGWISRYAWGKDYHRFMKEKLERLRQQIEALAPGTESRVYVDTGPIVERAFARFSGIGWMGKNTCLINKRKGSWFFLGVILSSLALPPDLPDPDRCGSCTRCLEACPTGALVRPYVMDASRCISYLTIEQKGSIPVEFRRAVGLNVFGCDICQDVCPWNAPRQSSQPPGGQPARVRRPAISDRPEFQPLEIKIGGPNPPENPDRPETRVAADCRFCAQLSPDTLKPARALVSLHHPPLRALAALSEEDFRRVFSRSPVKRAKYRGWLRNLCVAMGNSGDASFVSWLKHACEHPDRMIREHASWALERLGKTGGRFQATDTSNI